MSFECFHPMEGRRMKDGSLMIMGAYRDHVPDQGPDVEKTFRIPCRHCTACRARYRAIWLTRLEHEATLHEHSAFVTLTYAPEHLPPGGSLCHRDIQLFFKRLRFNLPYRVRYFMCGEYGPTTQRPHYHLIIFGLHLTDLQFHRKSAQGHSLYRSPLIEESWGLGHSEVGLVEPASMSYVVKYNTKKLDDKGDVRDAKGEGYWSFLDPETGELIKREREYIVMSRKPGIGAGWFDKYKDDIKKGFIVINGQSRTIPPYYIERWKKDPEDSEALEQFLIQREEHVENLPVTPQVDLVRKEKFRAVERERLINQRTSI